MLEFKYDTQLLIEGTDLDEDVITEYITEHFKGDCLLANVLTTEAYYGFTGLYQSSNHTASGSGGRQRNKLAQF